MRTKGKLIVFLLLNTLCFAQNKDKGAILFTIDDKPYYTNEFSRIYQKNIDLIKDENQKDITHYLDLFIEYKLKTTKAKQLGLDKSQNYLKELASYRSQLAKNYLSDSKVTEELIQEAYDRSLKEVKASHILVLVDENADPKDTLVAYNKIIEIRKKAVSGDDFGALAEQFSEDPSAKDNNGNAGNKGDLGYFSVFRMVYPFETGAYKTKKGEISKPVRTRFGYHIIKVSDIRDYKGDLKIAHIMVSKTKDTTKNANENAKKRIDDIYKKIKQGESFEALAKEFSDDKITGKNGGVINKISPGQSASKLYEDTAYSLTKEISVSEPFETPTGWYIIKLLEKLPQKTYAEQKPDLEKKLRNDERSKILRTMLADKLRKKYVIKKNEKLFDQISKSITKDIQTGTCKLPIEDKVYESALLEINDKKVDGKTFLRYIDNNQKMMEFHKTPFDKVAIASYKKFEIQQINSYYNSNLENEFPEFADIMDEYRDGLLLFDLMEKEIWEKSKKDTIGLKKFYESHLNNYQWKERAEATIFSSVNKNVLEKTQKMIKQKKSTDLIKSTLNTDNKVQIIEKQGVFDLDGDELPKGIKKQVGLSDIIKQGDYYYVVNTKTILPQSTKKYEECSGKVINDYQQNLEENWITALKNEFKLNVNQAVFEKLKTEINKK
jgi:peptidyl-prolyl cis-trans isomerase SurA